MKLTKAQWKNRDRILAWLNGEPFKENSRSKPSVPELPTEEILETYVPPDVTGAGQYFTPVTMADSLLGHMDIPWGGSDISILDPCAGIGHLLYPLTDRGFRLVAYELEEECVKIGRKLFPEVEWNWEIPFDHLDKLEGQFDLVIMNPPFSTRRGMAPGEGMCEGRCTKSEYIFFELAVRTCKQDGQIGVIAPYNFTQKFPKPFKKWLEDRVELECEMGQLPGVFAYSGISVNGFIFRRKDEVAEWVHEVNARGAELDDLCSAIHPTVWHEDPRIVKAQEEWKELAAKPSGKMVQLSLF